MTLEDAQYNLVALYEEFLLARKEDEWSQGVKDGLRKAMIIVGIPDYSAYTDRVEQVIQEQLIKAKNT